MGGLFYCESLPKLKKVIVLKEGREVLVYSGMILRDLNDSFSFFILDNLFFEQLINYSYLKV